MTGPDSPDSTADPREHLRTCPTCDPTGEGAEIQGEHLREWAKVGIHLRCCFWCTLTDVTARLLDAHEGERGEPCTDCDGKGFYTGWPHTTCPVCRGTGAAPVRVADTGERWEDADGEYWGTANRDLASRLAESERAREELERQRQDLRTVLADAEARLAAADKLGEAMEAICKRLEEPAKTDGYFDEPRERIAAVARAALSSYREGKE